MLEFPTLATLTSLGRLSGKLSAMQAQSFMSAILCIITSETVEKIDSCKNKSSHVLLIDNSRVKSTELAAGLYSLYTYCYYHCII